MPQLLSQALHRVVNVKQSTQLIGVIRREVAHLVHGAAIPDVAHQGHQAPEHDRVIESLDEFYLVGPGEWPLGSLGSLLADQRRFVQAPLLLVALAINHALTVPAHDRPKVARPRASALLH